MGKFTEYKLQLKSMPVGVHEYDYRLGKQFFVNMENADVRDAAIDAHLTVDHRGDYFDLTFRFSGEVTVACDRCLDDLVLPVDTDYHIVVKFGEDYNDDNDEYLEIPDNETSINTAYMMHDSIALAIPIKHVHPLGKCNRAMSSLLKKHRAAAADDEDAALADELIDEMDTMDTSAADTPSDSRWDKLKDFRPDGDN